MNSDEFYMTKALDEARAAFARDEVPIGAVLVDCQTGDIVARAGNATIAQNDPTAHAEILCIRHECKMQGAQRLPDYDLYVTLEPCPMCAAALSFARIRRIVVGALDAKSGGLVSGACLSTHPTIHHKSEIITGVMADESGALLKEFFALKRAHGGRYRDGKIHHPTQSDQ